MLGESTQMITFSVDHLPNVRMILLRKPQWRPSRGGPPVRSPRRRPRRAPRCQPRRPSLPASRRLTCPCGSSVSLALTRQRATRLTSAPFRAQAPGLVCGQLYGRRPHLEGSVTHRRFPVAFRLATIGFLAVLFPPRISASLAVGLPAAGLIRRTVTGFPCSALVRRGRCRGRVGPPHCCGGPPLRTGLARFPGIAAQASSGASRAGRNAGPFAPPTASRRAQWVCMRRNATGSSVVPRPASAVIACRRIALRVTLNHCSHSWGVCGSWSACSSSPRQTGQRPCAPGADAGRSGPAGVCGGVAVRPSSQLGPDRPGTPRL